MTTANDDNSVDAYYRQQIESLDAQIAEIGTKDRQLSRMRGIVFLVSLAFFLGGITGYGNILFVLAGLVFIGFVAVIGYHESVQRKRDLATTQRTLFEMQQNRIERNWASLPKETLQLSDAAQGLVADGSSPVLDQSVTADLDVFGAGSIWQLLNRAATPLGQKTMHDWLRNPASCDEIRLRQAAVKKLSADPEFCQRLFHSGQMLCEGHSNTIAFLEWAEGESWLGKRANVKWATRLLTAAMILLPVCLVMHWLPAGWAFVALGVVAVNVIVNMIWIGDVHNLYNRISAGKYDMLYYTELFRAVAELPDDTPKLAALKSQMQIGDVGFEEALGKLQRILKFTNGRKSGLLGLPWLCAQILWFWDFHVLGWLEQWQAQFGKNVRTWFEAVAELESLASLATLAHDNPAWQFPTVDEAESKVAAAGMGHALLPPTQCVLNDVELGPQGTFLMVTGSNMSGKSTLLRSIGVNALLAQAGGPVCAKSFRLPPVELATSMRVTDSLNSGVSYFMAELKRVKSIVDRARELDDTSKPRQLYLLDEILQGTNSAERHVAVTRILGHLLRTRAIGAVSTHDLELADSSEIKNDCQLVHLRETIEKTDAGDKMRFDYIVRPGVTPTTNALRLLEMVGLGEGHS